MSRIKHIIFCLIILHYCNVVSVAITDFSRYEAILDRKPFGQPPAAPTAATSQIPVPPSFIKDLKMVAITKDEVGIQVGFINESTKPPQSYLLRIGESQDGIKVMDADYEMEAALLQKGSEDEWLYMSGSPQAGVPQARKSSSTPSPGATSDSLSEKKTSYAEKLKLRREALQTRRVESPKMSSEELEKHLREYNLEAIRKGLPALPIQLTPEEDDQLVNEGVLPPKQ